MYLPMARTVALTILGVVALVVAGTLFGGCAGAELPSSAYTPNSDDDAFFGAIEQSWLEAGLEDYRTDRYDELRPYLRVAVVGDEDFGGFCARCPPGNCPGYRGSAGCSTGCASECYVSPCVGSWPHCWGTGNEFLGGHETPIIVVHESQAPRGYPDAALVRHGYLHFLGDVSGRGTDPWHLDAAMWALDTPPDEGSGSGASVPREAR